LAGLALLAVIATVGRMTWLLRLMQPRRAGGEVRPMPAAQVGGLKGAGWLTRSPEERVGFWLCLTLLKRDPGLAMRCLLAFNLAVAVVVLGVATGQFGNPCRESEPSQVLAPILAIYLLALALPPLVYNLSFSHDSAGSWLLLAAPLSHPGG